MKKILKFYSKTCGPCKVMSKKLEELKNVEIKEIDIADEASDIFLNEYKVKSIPTIVVIAEDNSSLAKFVGITSVEDIQSVIDGREAATT